VPEFIEAKNKKPFEGTYLRELIASFELLIATVAFSKLYFNISIACVGKK